MLPSTLMTTVKRSRGANCFKSGNNYEQTCYSLLKSLCYKNKPIQVETAAGATANTDIPCMIPMENELGETNLVKVGFEIKNKGAFEGGAKKLYATAHGLAFAEECIHKTILGERILYEGKILPWYENKKTAEDWKAVESIFKPDIYIDAPSNAISEYYQKKGVYYIQVEKKGLYHTGTDILALGVPFFEGRLTLRIRCSKHIKQGIPTDITAGLQFDRKSLKASPFSLDTTLPPCFTKA